MNGLDGPVGLVSTSVGFEYLDPAAKDLAEAVPQNELVGKEDAVESKVVYCASYTPGAVDGAKSVLIHYV